MNTASAAFYCDIFFRKSVIFYSIFPRKSVIFLLKIVE